MKHLWGSRFSKALDEKVHDFNSSLGFDCKLYREDIEGSAAHCKMLCDCAIITAEEKDKITTALAEILSEIEQGKIEFDPKFEDIHSYIEKLLVEKTGDTGKKVHTARSRNDQVALDIRLYLRAEIKNIKSALVVLIKTLLDLSAQHAETIMPGYTHLQRAQSTTLAHHLGAYVEMFKRDVQRLDDIYKRVNVSPLGACALAGTSHPIDRDKTAQYLGFDGIALNSIDAVSDRDFAIETLAALSLVMMHLSRMSEEIVLWSSFEFGFVELDDAYSTGSSIMPQKKNPDIAELTRGKTGRVYGDLVALLTTMKSLPLAYNKDMQEDKEPLFDAVQTVQVCLEVLPDMLKTMVVKKDNMLSAVKKGFLDATDVADYLVKKGLAFRDTHEIAGKIVARCIENNKTIEELELSEFKEFSELFDDDIYAAINPVNSINAKQVIGSPAFNMVKKVIEINNKWVEENNGK